MKNEPVRKTAIIVSVVGATITLLLAFGVPLTDEQVQAIQGLVIVVAPLIVGEIARRRVDGPETKQANLRRYHGH